jgi:hypothetical protein
MGLVLNLNFPPEQRMSAAGIIRLPQHELRLASEIMSVPSAVIIQQLLNDTVLSLLGLSSSKLLFAQCRKSTIYQAGVERETYFNSAGGRLVIERDGFVLRLEGFRGDRRVFEVAIRDRRLDGMGQHGKTSPLNHFPVNHEATNSLPHPHFRSAELSVYSHHPEQHLADGLLRDFISDPDKYIYPWNRFNPEVFFALWQQAMVSDLAPWQPAPPLRGFAQHFVCASEDLLKKLGYNRAESVPSWYNSALFFSQKMGYEFNNPAYGANFTALQQALAEVSECQSSKATNLLPLAQRQMSWVVALQNIPSLYLSERDSPYYARFGQYWLRGLYWTNSPTTTDSCARLYKTLNEFRWTK